MPQKQEIKDKIQHHIESDDLFNYAENLDFGEIHCKIDQKTGLRAIIAIHNTNRGPALGGCRFISYPSTNAAIVDALRLAQGMSYKAAISDLPLGGGKSVLFRQADINDHEAYFGSFGKFINELNGRYITAPDAGTDITKMKIIARHTNYVVYSNERHSKDIGPSPFTALGVHRGIKAAVKHKLGTDVLRGLHIVIQGVGHVGYNLAKTLHAEGTKLTICDKNTSNIERCVNEFGVDVIDIDSVYQVECDVFSPCALGACLNTETVPQLNTHIIAGSANNQLATNAISEMLLEHDILYAPDYVVNAGGLIHAASDYGLISTNESNKKVFHIYDTLLDIFQQADKEKQPTSHIADEIAKAKIEGAN